MPDAFDAAAEDARAPLAAFDATGDDESSQEFGQLLHEQGLA